MSEVGESGRTGVLQKAVRLITDHFGVNPDRLPDQLPLEQINEGAVAYYIWRDIGDAFAKKYGGNEYHRPVTPSVILQNMGYHLPFGKTDLFERYPVEHQKVNTLLQELARQGVLHYEHKESDSFYQVIDPGGIQTRASQWSEGRKLAGTQKVKP